MSSPSTAATVELSKSPRAVAPAWHTGIVLLALFGLSFVGARTGNPGLSRYGRAGSYISVMAFEWIMVAFVWWGVSRQGIGMSDLVGGRWMRLREVFRDLGIALGFLFIGNITLQGLAYVLRAQNPVLRNLLPRTHAEVILWIVLSLTAGICEEILFRGYLQRQFSALTHSVTGGILLQGLAFGGGHGYQGWKLMVAISVYGIIFGVLAQWRRSLRPGMMAHFLQDGVGGLLLRHVIR